MIMAAYTAIPQAANCIRALQRPIVCMGLFTAVQSFAKICL